MTYDGRPLWEETHAPFFDTTANKHDIIMAHRFVFIQPDYSIRYTGEEGYRYGVTLEADGVSAGGVAMGLITQHNPAMYKGSNVEVAVRRAGTKRVEMASVGKRGDWVVANAQGQGVVTTDAELAIAQLKEDCAVGSLALIEFNGLSGAASAPARVPLVGE